MSDAADGSGGEGAPEIARLRRNFIAERTFEHHLGFQVVEARPGHAVLAIDVQEFHLNGNGTLHGGVYASLIDNAMGLAVAALAQVRIATTQMNVHFLAAVKEGQITCTGEVVHRTRRTATAEAKVRDAAGNLVAMGTGAFRIFEQQGQPIV